MNQHIPPPPPSPPQNPYLHLGGPIPHQPHMNAPFGHQPPPSMANFPNPPKKTRFDTLISPIMNGTTYQGWTLAAVDQAKGVKGRWHNYHKDQMEDSQSDLEAIVRRNQEKEGRSPQSILKSKAMEGLKRDCIEMLLKQINEHEFDPDSEWKLAMLKLNMRKGSGKQIDCLSMNVIVKRVLRPAEQKNFHAMPRHASFTQAGGSGPQQHRSVYPQEPHPDHQRHPAVHQRENSFSGDGFRPHYFPQESPSPPLSYDAQPVYEAREPRFFEARPVQDPHIDFRDAIPEIWGDGGNDQTFPGDFLGGEPSTKQGEGKVGLTSSNFEKLDSLAKPQGKVKDAMKESKPSPEKKRPPIKPIISPPNERTSHWRNSSDSFNSDSEPSSSGQAVFSDTDNFMQSPTTAAATTATTATTTTKTSDGRFGEHVYLSKSKGKGKEVKYEQKPSPRDNGAKDAQRYHDRRDQEFEREHSSREGQRRRSSPKRKNTFDNEYVIIEPKTSRSSGGGGGGGGGSGSRYRTHRRQMSFSESSSSLRSQSIDSFQESSDSEKRYRRHRNSDRRRSGRSHRRIPSDVTTDNSSSDTRRILRETQRELDRERHANRLRDEERRREVQYAGEIGRLQGRIEAMSMEERREKGRLIYNEDNYGSGMGSTSLGGYMGERRRPAIRSRRSTSLSPLGYSRLRERERERESERERDRDRYRGGW